MNLSGQMFGILALTILFGLFYVLFTYKFLMNYFQSIAKPLNNVLKLFLIIGFYGFSICLIEFWSYSSNLKPFGNNTSDFALSLLMNAIFLICSFIFSALLFKLSDGIVKSIMKENHKLQMIHNNYMYAGVQAIIFIILVHISSALFVELIITNYPLK